MKKIIVLTIVLIVNILANDVEFYNPSFNCSKVKENSIEYKICTNEELSKLDNELSSNYKDIVLVDDQIKTTQRTWMKERNGCKNNECIKEAYLSQIDKLKYTTQQFLKKLEKANKKAKTSYENNKDPYIAINILKKAGMKEAIDKHPSFFTKEKYVDIMQNYASYYINTKHDMAHQLNLDYAKKILDLATQTAPKNPNSYKLLGQLYLDIFLFSRTASTVCPICEEYFDNVSWRFMPYKMKQAYSKYMTLCKEQNIKPNLTPFEQTIVDRNQMFIDYYSTFKGQSLTYINPPKIDKTLMYKKGFENICSEYVAMLNILPEDDRMDCSRYVNQPNSKFEHILEDKAPKEYRKYIIPNEVGQVGGQLFKYKNEYFYDNDNALISENQLGDGDHYVYPSNYPKNACLYQYIDMRLKNQSDLSFEAWNGCRSIRNYREKYITK